MKHMTCLIALATLALACASKPKSGEPAAANAKSATASKVAPAKAAAKDVKPEKTAPAKVAAGSEVRCKSGAEERVIAIQTDGGKCEVMYTKAGEAKSVATSMTGGTHCEDVAGRIRGKLEGAGYKCE
jgi:hypothetical protein